MKVVKENGSFKVIPSAGGLATGLDSLETSLERHWVGWPGIHLDDGEEKIKIDHLLQKKNYHPVDLSPEQIENYYEGYGNSVLWPLCHYFPNYIEHEDKYRQAYYEVNALFCEAASKVIEPGDMVWVHDYHLMLLPKIIRDRIRDVSIGYFHHIPFPSYELFRTLPERADILKGLLGADLIAFHTHGYMHHFIRAVYRVLNLDCDLDEIFLDGRVACTNAFPMGINYEKYHDAILRPGIRRKAEKLRKGFGNGKLILSVDRLDYSKGILTRLKSFDGFLEHYPQYREKVSLVIVVAPSREHVAKYSVLKEEIDRTVGGINGKYSTVDWRPVYYFYRTFGFNGLIPLYYIADAALITPLRDGMNLVAKEYIAAKRDTPGVLILSEMAGASVELADALIVNPSDSREIENAIATAMEIPVDRQMEALRAMQKIVSEQTVGRWAADFMAELAGVKAKNDLLHQKVVKKKNFDTIKGAYDKALNRLIILDYDGTLTPFSKDPKDAVPSPELIDLLLRLAGDLRNRVVISSGRDRQTLDLWLGSLPVGLSAEHGAFYKEHGTWHHRLPNAKWDEEISEIIRRIVKRTPRSEMEVKDTALVWHYRNVDVWLAELRVTELINALINPCFRRNLQIMKGNRIVEVKPAGVGKGVEAERLVSEGNYDFIMAIGDDTTDEEMFLALPARAITIKVGKSSNAARYYFPSQPQTVSFLDKLTGTR